MNSFMKFIQSIKTRIMKPKVYALVLDIGTSTFLSLQSAYSLEEAYGFAREEWRKQNPLRANEEAKIKLFDHRELDVLFGRFITTEIKEVGEKDDPKVDSLPENRAVLMKQIVDLKDEKLLKASKSVLSDAEFKYLSDLLKKKSNEAKN